MTWIIYSMVYLGSLLMVWNIYGFIRYAREMKARSRGSSSTAIVQVPIVLLVLFLLGYLAVGIFGKPDLIVSAILFGGSVFVFVMYRLLNRITRRIAADEKARAELKTAEETSRAKTSFMASVSHEMRTPMNVILGLDAMALKDPELKGETREKLEKIGQSGRHLLDLIDNTLQMHQLESGELRAKEEVFSLRDVLDQVAAIAGTQCEEKGLDWAFTVQEGLEDRCMGDGVMLKQALLAVLDNAVKFTDAPGRVRLAVRRVYVRGDVRTLQFAVQDTGIGMSQDFLPKVFDLYTREDGTASSRFSGSGMGLTGARNRVRLMGGEISVTSEQGVGSTFTITAPFRIPAEEAPSAGIKEEQLSLAGRRVLIVEDVAENAELTADQLELEDVLSERAEDGQKALDMFSASAEGYYDAILMDLRMPVMDGLEATRRIRALDRSDARKIPIIALTANALESDMRQTQEAGMNAHLAKPTDTELLYATLREWMRKAS